MENPSNGLAAKLLTLSLLTLVKITIITPNGAQINPTSVEEGPSLLFGFTSYVINHVAPLFCTIWSDI